MSEELVVEDTPQSAPLRVVFEGRIKFLFDPKNCPGKYYSLSRLGWEDARRTANTLSHIILRTQLMGDAMTEDLLGPALEKEGFARFLINLFMGLPEEMDQLYELLAPILQDQDGKQMEAADFKIREKFPIGTIWRLADAIQEHPDLEDFLAEGHQYWKQLMAKLPQQVQDFVAKASTPLGGNTEKSATKNGGSDPSISSGPATS